MESVYQVSASTPDIDAGDSLLQLTSSETILVPLKHVIPALHEITAAKILSILWRVEVDERGFGSDDEVGIDGDG
jgi:hypothetical protein